MHVRELAISIHVLRVEDDYGWMFNAETEGISIHVLRVEDDPLIGWYSVGNGISIHVLRVEDDVQPPHLGGRSWVISIHVLRVEDDLAGAGVVAGNGNFNPRPPCGGRRYSSGKRQK